MQQWGWSGGCWCREGVLVMPMTHMDTYSRPLTVGNCMHVHSTCASADFR